MLLSLRNFAITFIVSLLIFGVLLYGVSRFAVDSFSSGFGKDTEAPETTGEETQGVFNPFENPDTGDSSTIQGTSFNFLLVGLDYQEGVFDDYSESMKDYINEALGGVQAEGVETLLTYEQKRDVSADAILVGRVDKEDRRLVLTSLPGNARVFIDGVYTDLGSVLVNKGIDFLCGKITALTGFAIDYYGVVSIPTMEKIIDKLGGLSFRIPCNMEYEDPVEGLTISLKEGTKWLTGAEALQVLRYASYEDRDISRMQVMRDMAASMLTSVGSITTLANAPDLYKSLKNGVATNLSHADFTDNLDLIFRLSDFEVIDIPYPGVMTEVGGDPMFNPNIKGALTALAPYKN